MTNNKPISTLGKFLGLIAAVFGIMVLLVLFSANSIQYGTVGIVTRFGAITERTLEPGLHFVVPIVDSVVNYRTQKITYETSEHTDTSKANYTDQPVDTTTKDGQQVLVRYTIRFAIDPQKVRWIAENIGTEAELVEKIVKAESRVYVRNTVRGYDAGTLYTGEIKQAQDELTKQLEVVFSENGILLDSFGIRQITFQPDYLAAIEAKQIEKEKVVTEQYKADQEKFRKEQVITKAQGDAEAQRLQQQTLSKELIQKQWIEKWDGKLPTYIAGDGNGLLIGAPTK